MNKFSYLKIKLSVVLTDLTLINNYINWWGLHVVEKQGEENMEQV